MTAHTTLPTLIVDDYRESSRLIRHILVQLGFRDVQEVTSAIEALERLREQRYGLVISDWNMEPMSGLELLQKVRADPDLHSIPFIMVSGSSEAGKILAAKEAGVTDYVLKPFTAEVWKTKLRGLLGSR